MEFASCPSCKQSVLDDDAVDCPFCGSPMKLKPGAARPPAAARPAAKPQAPARSGKLPPKPSASDDSPFDPGVDLSVKSIPASATRTKSRTLEVRCPMCETVGYVPPDAAGQAVKCPNSKCLVPVFSAPRPVSEKPVVKPAPVKPKRSLLAVGGVTVLIMAVGGGVAYFLAGIPQTKSFKPPTAADLELVKLANQNPPAVAKSGTQETGTKPTSETPDGNPAVATERAGSQNSLLLTLNEAALQPQQNRSKPFCRRLTAESFALAGDLKGAQVQLEALEKVGGEVPFYQVTPLVEIAWRQWSQGQKKSAKKSLDAACLAAEKLPQSGRDRLETVISLAAILIATQRSEEARALLEVHRAQDEIAQLAQAHCAVQALGTFDLAESARQRPVLDWQSPLAVGVVLDLAGHGQLDAAQAWAGQLADPRERAEALAAWAEGAVRRHAQTGNSIAPNDLRTVLDALPQPGQVLAVARLGLALAWSGKSAEAGECFERAAAGVAGWDAVSEIELPDDLQELTRFQAPAYGDRSFQIAAVAEAARLASVLKRPIPMEQLVDTALSRARALAPGPWQVQRRTQEVKAGGIAALRDRLRQQLKLKTDNQAQVAATALQKNLAELDQAAQQRVELQTRILTQAVQWGLADMVWTYIRRGPTAEDAAQADNLIFSPLPGLLAEKFQSQGNADRHELVTTAWRQLVSDRPLNRPLVSLVEEALKSSHLNDHLQAVELLKSLTNQPGEHDWLALEIASQLAQSGRWESAFGFTARIANPVLKEECYLLIAGVAGKQGKTAVIEQQLAELTQATEKVALGRGLIAGESFRRAAAESPDQPAP